MSKVLAAQIKNILKTDGFFPHKGNAKGNTVIYSRNHPTAKFVRVVVDSGIHEKSGKFTGQPRVKLCYINRNKSWREITIEIFTDPKKLTRTIKAQEAAEKFVESCKSCKAKKFRAKSGNVVCANACWTTWGGKKKSQNTTKKTSQKIVAQNIGPRELRDQARQKKSQRVTPKRQRTYPLNKSTQIKLEKFAAKILAGDLVTVEEILNGKVKEDFAGSILGIIMKVPKKGRITVSWTANTSVVPDWYLPVYDHYDYRADTCCYRFRVLSRDAKWVKLA